MALFALPPAGATVRSPIEEKEVFARQVIAFVAVDDAGGLAEIVRYPFTTRREGQQITITSPEKFVEQYSRIMTERTKQDILSADVDSIFSNWQGFMLGQGGIWFEHVEAEGFRIIAINSLSA